MKLITKENNNYVLRLDEDEELIQTLIAFCKKSRIKSGFFSGLGAAKETVISEYSLAKKRYSDKTIKSEMEIAGLIGNIAKMDKKIIIHAHAILSNFNKGVTGGHVKKLVVGATCEIFLKAINKTIKREFSPEIGLNLMK